jgi:hypothetical protein
MLSLRFLPFFFRFLSSVLGNCFASRLNSTLASLTLLPAQLLFGFHSYLIIIFYSPKGHHSHLILNFISQTIHVSGNLLLASEVTPGLQQEQSPMPISLCHDLFNGVIKWKLTHNDVVLTPKLGQACMGK